MDKLYEIRTVVVPDAVDNLKTVKLGSNLIANYPNVRYKLIKFRHYGVRENFSSTREPDDTYMKLLRDTALKAGVKDVLIV